MCNICKKVGHLAAVCCSWGKDQFPASTPFVSNAQRAPEKPADETQVPMYNTPSMNNQVYAFSHFDCGIQTYFRSTWTGGKKLTLTPPDLRTHTCGQCLCLVSKTDICLISLMVIVQQKLDSMFGDVNHLDEKLSLLELNHFHGLFQDGFECVKSLPISVQIQEGCEPKLDEEVVLQTNHLSTLPVTTEEKQWETMFSLM